MREYVRAVPDNVTLAVAAASLGQMVTQITEAYSTREGDPMARERERRYRNRDDIHCRAHEGGLTVQIMPFCTTVERISQLTDSKVVDVII